MITNNNDIPSDDLELVAMLDQLRDTPARDARVVSRARAQYISDVNQMYSSDKTGALSRVKKLLAAGWLGQARQKPGKGRGIKLSYSFLALAAVLGVILFSGAGATAYAAQSALPGDALYPVKMTIEQAQIKLVADAARLAELHLEFAEHRLDEISGLIAERRYGEIERATQEFEYHVLQALAAMQIIADGDPLRAQGLEARVMAALSEYARSLASMKMDVPESTRASMDRAIFASQSAGEMDPAELIENANLNDNDGEGDPPGSGHENDQSNQNEGIQDENENHNGESNTNNNNNENEASNENSDDQDGGNDQNGNSNLNDHENDNDNESGGDNSNDQANNNDNDNDRDDGNDNNDNGGNENSGDD